MDVIADLLTRIRNASRVHHRVVEAPSSKVKLGILDVLKDQGYILGYRVFENGPKRTVKIALKYDPISKEPAITKIVRISKPGLRNYSDAQSMPRVMNGLGVAIVSTSKGIMSDKEARANKVGGEVLCFVY